MNNNSDNSDILFKDHNICILKPESRRGILVFHVSKSSTICSEGLYSYNELLNQKPGLGLQPKEHMFPEHSDIIYFRAPYNSETTSFQSLYPDISFIKDSYYVLIRIDPDNTYVYNQEGRVYSNYEEYKSSKISMTEYFKIIKINKLIKPEYQKAIYGNTISFKKILMRNHTNKVGTFKKYLPTERMGEILAKRPHIPNEWFYYCGKINNISDIPDTYKQPQNGEPNTYKQSQNGGKSTLSKKYKKHKSYKKQKTHKRIK
jgi:hypothetical protein